MSRKITQLPSATQITGRETLPLVQNGRNVSAGVGVSQIPQGFGALPANYPAGSISYVVDAVGGAQPAFSTGTQWKTFSGNINVKTMGVGIWMIGVGLSLGPAHANGADTGFYFVSEDGFSWTKYKMLFMDKGIENISYANGCFLASGHTSFGLFPFGTIGAMESTNTDPRDPTDWQISLPYGNQEAAGTTAGSPVGYNNDTGVFSVPIFPGGGIQSIFNKLPSAADPDPGWPWLGQDVYNPPLATSVLGVGTKGLVEVKISQQQLSVAGTPWTSDFLEVRNFGTSEYVDRVDFTFAFPDPRTAAGLILRGLVWGPIKQTAVQFNPGGT